MLLISCLFIVPIGGYKPCGHKESDTTEWLSTWIIKARFVKAKFVKRYYPYEDDKAKQTCKISQKFFYYKITLKSQLKQL